MSKEDDIRAFREAAATARAVAKRAGVKVHPRVLAIKKGRPRIEDRDKTIEAKKPWLALGMSRSTWYGRRQAEKRNPKPKGE